MLVFSVGYVLIINDWPIKSEATKLFDIKLRKKINLRSKFIESVLPLMSSNTM